MLDSGANQEIVYVARHIVPIPAAPAPNVVLTAPLTKSHAAGAPTLQTTVTLRAAVAGARHRRAVYNPRPLIPAATATTLQALLAEAKERADAGSPKSAVSSLTKFKAAAAAAGKTRAALISAADALIAELRGATVDTSGTGVVAGPADPGDQVIREFYNPSPFGQPRGDVQGARQRALGRLPPPVDRRLRVDDPEARRRERLRRRHLGQPRRLPGRPAPAGVSLTDEPVPRPGHAHAVQDGRVRLDRRSTGLNAVEFANLQAYIRAGGGIVSIHGAVDSMQNVPWYMDLVGAGFTNHGSNPAAS